MKLRVTDSRSQRLVGQWQPRHLLIGLIFVATLAWFSVGLFPAVPVEGDDLAIAAGALFLADGGSPSHPLVYRYDPQSGIYWLVSSLYRRFGIDTAVGLAWASGLGGILLWWTSAFYATYRVNNSHPMGLWLPLLIQELWVASYFGNSTMPAAALVGLALVVLPTHCSLAGMAGNSLIAGNDTRRLVIRIFVGSTLLACGTWFRFDAILALPAALWICLVGETHRLLCGSLFLFAYLGTLFALLTGTDVRVDAIFAQGISHAFGFAELRQSLISWTVWSSVPLVVLMVFGIARLRRQKSRKELGLIALGILPSLCAYGWNLTTPKYLLYTTPFVCRLASHGLGSISIPRGFWGKIATLFILFISACQLIGGPLTVATWVTRKNWVVAGTHDGPRRLEGLLWNPIIWCWMKSEAKDVFPQASVAFEHAIMSRPHCLVLVDDWFSSAWAVRELLRLGWWPRTTRRHFDSIKVPEHCDHIEFQTRHAASDKWESSAHFSHADARVGLFEIEWLEGPSALPDIWLRSWDDWLEKRSSPVIWVSGRRHEPGSLQEAIDKLPTLRDHRIKPVLTCKVRPWIFALYP